MRSHQTTATDMEIFFHSIPFVSSVHRGGGVPGLLMTVYNPFHTVLRLGVLENWRDRESFSRPTADGAYVLNHNTASHDWELLAACIWDWSLKI